MQGIIGKRFYFFLLLFCLGLFFCTRLIGASLQKPEILLDDVTQQMLSALKTHEQTLKTNPEKIVNIVDNILVPHIESEHMAKWVVGRAAWMEASQDERRRFIREFKELMIRTYATTITSYDNQIIEYFPSRGDYKTKKRIQVSSTIREPGKETIRVAYRLVRRGSEWKVYDIIIEGVSLLKGFQAQFANDIKQLGLDKVIQRIQEHNKKPLS